MKRILLFILVLFAIQQHRVYGQCTSAAEGQYPITTVALNTTCAPKVLATDCYTDEYSVVSGADAQTYIFSSSVGTDFITIADDATNNAIASGTSPLTYTFGAAPGNIRIYRHDDNTCPGTTGTDRTISVQCSSCAAPTSITTQPSITNVTAGTINNQILRLDANVCGTQTITSISFGTTGSTSPTTDISNAKVYYTSTTTFSTTTQYGTTVADPNGSFTVSGSQVITTVGYFWLTYDLKCGATGANVVDGECTSFEASSTVTPIPTNPTGTRTITASATTITTVQPSTAVIAIPSNNNQVLRMDVTSCANTTVTQLDLATTGSDNPATDISNAKVYFTTTTTFSTAVQFGTTVSNPNGSFSVTGSQLLTSGTGYFWLTYDVPGGATVNNVVDGECTLVTIDAIGNAPGTTNPAGTRQLIIPPSNDECSGAIALTVNADLACGTTTSGNTVNATQSTETAPSCSATGVDDDIWYSFTATGAKHTLVLSMPSVSMAAAVYSGNCGSLTQLIGACSSGAGTVTINLTGLINGTTYRVRVFTTASSGNGTVTLCLGTPPVIPADDCSNPIDLAGETSPYNGTTVGATSDFNLAGSCANTAPDKLYTINVASNNVLHIGQTVNAYDSRTYIGYAGACPGTTQIACFDDSDLIKTKWLNNTGSGQLVNYVQDGHLSNSGTFTLAWLNVPQEANDECAGAVSVSTSASGACSYTTYSTSGGTKSTGNPACTSTDNDEDVWFTFTTGAAGAYIVRYNNLTATFGTAATMGIDLYTGACGSLAAVGGVCNNTLGSAGTGSATITLAAATTYTLRLWITGNTTQDAYGVGTFGLCVEQPAACPVPSALISGTITGNSAILNWTENGSATTWDISYGVAPLADPNTGTIVSGITKPYTLMGLTGSTTYDWYARAICGGTPSAWSAKATFNTLLANDDCSGAVTIPCGGSVTGNNTTAADDVLPTPTCGSTTVGRFKGLWYTVTPTLSGATTVSVCSGTAWDSYIRVYNGGSCGAFTTCTGFNDDGCGSQSTVTFTAVAGTTYYVLLGGYDAAEFGAFTISATCPAPMTYVSSTVGAETTTSVAAGTVNASIIRLDVVVTGTGSPLNVTSLTCSTNGSTAPVTENVITGKVYYTGTSGTFSTATLVGSAAIAADGSFTIAGNQVLTGGVANTTNYFWLAYDLQCSAAVAELVDGEFNSVTVGGTPYTPTLQLLAGSRSIITAGFTVGTNQPSTLPIGAGAIDGQILRIDVVGSAICGNLTQVVAATTGTTNVTDLSRAKLYYTGTSTTFSNTTQFGATINSPNGTMTFDGTQALATGTNYFWLVYDMSCSATGGNVIDASLTNVTYNGTLTPGTPNPTGTRTITALASYDTKANGNWNDVNTWACSVPPSGTSIPININHNVTFNQDHVQNADLTIAAGRTLNWMSNTMTIGNTGTSASLIINGTMNVSGGILNVGTIASVTTSNISTAVGGTLNASGGVINLGPSGGFSRTLTNAGTFFISAGTVNINGSIASSGSFSMSAGDLVIDGNGGAASPTSTSLNFFAITVNAGTVSGGTITFVDPPFSGTNTQRVLSYSNGSDLSWTGNTIILGGSSGTHSSSATGGFSIDTYVGSARLHLANVTCSGGSGTNRFAAGPTSSANDINVAGTFTVNSGSEFRQISTGGSSLSGNIVNNGTITIINTLRLARNSTTAATTAQAISGSGVWRNLAASPTANIATLVVNNSSGTPITIPASMITGTGTGSVSGTLTLTNGILDIGAQTLTLGVSTGATGSLTAPSNTTTPISWIAGTFQRWVASGSTITRYFPVGTTTTSRLITINYTAGATTGGRLAATFNSSTPGKGGLPITYGGISCSEASPTGHWQLTPITLAGGTYTAIIDATGFRKADGSTAITDLAGIRLAKRPDAGNWADAATAAAPSNLNSITASAMTGFSVFGVIGTQAALPVELTSFTGQTRDKANMLKWSAESELNFDRYILERAPEVREELFTPITEVEGKGSVTQAASYEYTDEQPLPLSYYRLRMMDVDGTYKFSKIIVLENGKVGLGDVKAFPVPSSDLVYVTFNATDANDYRLILTDISGRVISNDLYEGTNGFNQTNLSLANYPSGVYYLSIVGGQVNRNIQLVKK